MDRAAKDPKRYLVLDASRPVESVATLIVDRVEPLIPPVPSEPSQAPVEAETAAPAESEEARSAEITVYSGLSEGNRWAGPEA